MKMKEDEEPQLEDQEATAKETENGFAPQGASMPPHDPHP